MSRLPTNQPNRILKRCRYLPTKTDLLHTDSLVLNTRKKKCLTNSKMACCHAHSACCYSNFKECRVILFGKMYDVPSKEKCVCIVYFLSIFVRNRRRKMIDDRSYNIKEYSQAIIKHSYRLLVLENTLSFTRLDQL